MSIMNELCNAMNTTLPTPPPPPRTQTPYPIILNKKYFKIDIAKKINLVFTTIFYEEFLLVRGKFSFEIVQGEHNLVSI